MADPLLIAPPGSTSQTGYASGQGAHQIHVLAGATPDAVVAHQARVYCFYMRTNGQPALQPAPAAMRHQINRVYR